MTIKNAGHLEVLARIYKPEIGGLLEI